MDVTKVDLARAENMLKMLKYGKFEMDGEQILAFAQTFHWFSDLMARIRVSLQPSVEMSVGQPVTRNVTQRQVGHDPSAPES